MCTHWSLSWIPRNQHLQDLFSGNQNDPIIFTHDAIFDHTQFFTGLNGFADGEDIEEEIELLAYPTPPQQEDVEQELLLTRQQAQCQLFDTPDVANNIQVGGETNDKLGSAQQISEQTTSLSTPSDNLHPLEKLSECEEFATPQPVALLNRQDCSKSPPPGYQKKGTKATKDINLSPNNIRLIITGKRTQKPPPDKNVYAIHAHALVTQGADLSQYLSAFATEVSKPAPVENIPCIHQSQLPKMPQFVKALDTHMFGVQFNKAMIKE